MNTPHASPAEQNAAGRPLDDQPASADHWVFPDPAGAAAGSVATASGVCGGAPGGPGRQAIERLGLPPLPEPLPAAVIDSHTHLDATKSKSGLRVAESWAAAAAVGVTRVVQASDNVRESEWAVGLASTHPNVVACVALHPNVAARCTDAALDEQLSAIDALAGVGRHVRAIGETGLDYYRVREESERARQRRSFAAHIGLAKAHDLTLVIHDRDAHDDIADVLDGEGWPQRVVMHCFSGDVGFARRCLDAGAWLSFAGTITFKNNDALREALAFTPDDRVLVETDAPYLTPMPWRGRPNAPYLLAHTVRFVGEELTRRGRTMPLDELCGRIVANTEAAFGGPWGAA